MSALTSTAAALLPDPCPVSPPTAAPGLPPAPVLLPILAVAGQLGIHADELDLYGTHKAKVHLDIRTRLADRPNGKYVVVSAITPTPLGEGKTVTAIGLAQALARSGRRTMICLRQPSLAPTFGVRGGGAGGGAARVERLADVNLHLTGDIHAVGAAHNLLAAAVDAHLFHGNALDIDPHAVTIQRVLDVDDRALRHIVIGLGKQGGWRAPRDGLRDHGGL
jgi:formate--tetrahydrofolate ligase